MGFTRDLCRIMEEDFRRLLPARASAAYLPPGTITLPACRGDMLFMRDRVVRKERCEPLGQLSPNN